MRANFDAFEGEWLWVSLFRNVTNVEEIKKEIQNEGSELSLIQPKLIINGLQIAIAANRALSSKKLGTMKTKQVHSELVFNLSGSGNIKPSLSTFGIEKDTDSFFIVAAISPSEEKIQKTIQSIKGEQLQIDNQDLFKFDFISFADQALIRKTYKMTEKEGTTTDKLLNAIINRISTRD